MQTIKDLKATIEHLTAESNQVFIVAHNKADFDAIASSVAMSLIIKILEKPVYIILEEDNQTIEPGVKKMIDEISDTVAIIDMNKYNRIKSDNDLLICLDVNKSYKVCCKDNLKEFKNILIIDHHHEDENTITTEYKYIKPDKVSSASEVLTDLLCIYKLKYNPAVANLLLAGIYVDTNRLTKKNSSMSTIAAVSKLLARGGDIQQALKYFVEDFNSDNKVNSLVGKAQFMNYRIGISVADETERYRTEELSKVADTLLRYDADATFAAGYIDDEVVAIKARSNGTIDVGNVMRELGGGGNTYSAATEVINENIIETTNKLVIILKPSFYKDEKN